MKLSHKQLAILAILFANMIWGAGPPLFKWSLGSVEPITLGFLRFFFGTIMLLPFTARRLVLPQPALLKVALAGFFGIFLNIAFYFVGLHYAPSINVTIIGAAGPIFILIASGHFFHEKVARKILYGTLLSLFGVMVIILQPFFDHTGHGTLLGNILFLLSTLSSLPYFFLLKDVVAEYNTTTVTFWTFFFGQFFFLPFFFWEAGQPGYFFHLNFQSFIGIFYGAIFSSALAYLFQGYALKYLLATEVTIFTYLDPVFTALVAMAVLGETISLTYILGSGLVFAGIFLAEGRFHHHQPIHRHRIRGL